MLLSKTGKNFFEKILLAFFYLATTVWIILLLLPFAWMISSSLKDKYSVFDMPPKWIPNLPITVTARLKYNLNERKETLKELKNKIIKDSSIVIWMLPDEFKKLRISSIKVEAYSDKKLIFSIYAPSYKTKELRNKYLPYAQLESSDFTNEISNELIKNLGGKFSFKKTKVKNQKISLRDIDKIHEIIKFLAKQNISADNTEIYIKPSFLHLFNNFIEAGFFSFKAIGLEVTFGRFILNSVIVTSSVIFLQLFISSIAAYALSRLFSEKLSKILLIFFLATTMIPSMLLFIPLFLMMRSFPFDYVPFTSIKIPTLNLANTYFALILPYTAWGFSILLFKGFFDQLPKELFEAARLDGASEFKIFTKIVFPLSRPVFSVMALFTFFAVWQDFLWPYIIAQDKSLWTYPVALFYAQSIMSEPNLILSMAVIASLPTIIVFILCQKLIERGIVWTAIKG